MNEPNWQQVAIEAREGVHCHHIDAELALVSVSAMISAPIAVEVRQAVHRHGALVEAVRELLCPSKLHSDHEADAVADRPSVAAHDPTAALSAGLESIAGEVRALRDGIVGCTLASPPAPPVPEAVDLALAADLVLQVFDRHRQVMLGSPDWSERDRASFAALQRAVGRFWGRGTPG